LYLLRESLSPSGSIKSGGIANTGDLVLEWSNTSSFQFKVTRRSTGEAIFDTYGKVIVFEDQFLEVVTAMVPDYNIYNDQPIDLNIHTVHPAYLDTRHGMAFRRRI
jgi:alpha-glucosidase